jgi:C4-dicarboxylate-specific signal transduction histidine kinase
MTEIATGVLHNVGNVLNSVNVSISVINDSVRRSKAPSVARVAALMKEQAPALAAATSDPKLQKLPDYLDLLSSSLAEEQRQVEAELANLIEKVQHIKNIISAQQNYTRRVCFRESIDLHHLIEDLLSMHAPAISKNKVLVKRSYAQIPTITIEKSKLLQVLDNLIKNALEAMQITEREAQHVLRITSHCRDQQLSVTIADTGHGITAEQLKCIFRFGFTTKTNGNGFGLHSAAIAMNEMGGAIQVHSDGLGQGAEFTITLPLNAPVNTETRVLPALEVSQSATPEVASEFA